MKTLEELKEKLEKEGELEVEGCIVYDSLNSDTHYDVIGLRYNQDKQTIIAIVDDIEKCEIIELPLDYFNEEDIQEIVLRTNDF